MSHRVPSQTHRPFPHRAQGREGRVRAPGPAAPCPRARRAGGRPRGRAGRRHLRGDRGAGDRGARAARPVREARADRGARRCLFGEPGRRGARGLVHGSPVPAGGGDAAFLEDPCPAARRGDGPARPLAGPAEWQLLAAGDIEGAMLLLEPERSCRDVANNLLELSEIRARAGKGARRTSGLAWRGSCGGRASSGRSCWHARAERRPRIRIHGVCRSGARGRCSCAPTTR
jgi:hypothetical protein